jgi:hypothetical protein
MPWPLCWRRSRKQVEHVPSLSLGFQTIKLRSRLRCGGGACLGISGSCQGGAGQARGALSSPGEASPWKLKWHWIGYLLHWQVQEIRRLLRSGETGRSRPWIWLSQN